MTELVYMITGHKPSLRRMQISARQRSILLSNAWLVIRALALAAIATALMATASHAQDLLYVRDGADGNVDGTDWNHAYELFSDAIDNVSRGDTIIVADGTYLPSGDIFDVAESEATYITILKATETYHGTETGWSSAYGDGQASFTGEITFRTGYWVWNGVNGTGKADTDSTDYGFKVEWDGDTESNQYLMTLPSIDNQNTDQIDHIIIEHTAFCMPGATFDVEQQAIRTCPDTLHTSYALTFRYNYYYEGTDNVVVRRSHDVNIHDSYFNGNWSSGTWHGEQFIFERVDTLNIYNCVFDSSSVYVVAVFQFKGTTDSTNATKNTKIYNNIVRGHRGSSLTPWMMCEGGSPDAPDAWWSADIHHNTIIDVTCSGRGVFFVGFFNYMNEERQSRYYNNLHVNCSNIGFNSYDGTDGCILWDYNGYHDTSWLSGWSFADSAGVNSYESVLDPFVNSPTNLHIASGSDPVGAGNLLASPFNYDYDGVERGDPPDVGAYEYVAAAVEVVEYHIHSGENIQATVDTAGAYGRFYIYGDHSDETITATAVGQQFIGIPDSLPKLSGQKTLTASPDSFPGSGPAQATIDLILDGNIEITGQPDYETARSQTSGTARTSYWEVGQRRVASDDWRMWRSFFSLALDISATSIDSLRLVFKGANNYSTNDFNLLILSAPTYAPTLAGDDWTHFDGYQSGLTQFNGSILSDHWNSISYNADSILVTLNTEAGKDSAFAAVGDTLRGVALSDSDYYALAPSGASNVQFDSSEDEFKPHATVFYQTSGGEVIDSIYVWTGLTGIRHAWRNGVLITPQASFAALRANGATGICYIAADSLYAKEGGNPIADGIEWVWDGNAIGYSDGGNDSTLVELIVFAHYNDTAFELTGSYGKIYDAIADTIKLGFRIGGGTGNEIKNLGVISDTDSLAYDAGTSSDIDYNWYGEDDPNSEGADFAAWQLTYDTNGGQGTVSGLDADYIPESGDCTLVGKGTDLGNDYVSSPDIGAHEYDGASLTITAPDGAETITTGNVFEITWTTDGVDSVKIEYSIDNGIYWTEIIASTASDGSYNWTPDDTTSVEALVRVTDVNDAGVSDESDAVFSLVYPREVTVLDPNGGESWEVESLHDILFHALSCDSVKVEYSLNNGSTWSNVIISLDASLGTYEWTLPKTRTDWGLVKVTDVDSLYTTDQSDAVFTITSGNEILSIPITPFDTNTAFDVGPFDY